MAAQDSVQKISEGGRAFLLELARETIAARMEGRAPPSDQPGDPALLEHRGAFVTLTIDGRLRGCIGHVVAVAELWLAVRENAEAAAFGDPRFPALGSDEITKMLIEVSALTPLASASPCDIVAGRDGVLIRRGSHQAVLLPQVALEYGWNVETLLDAVCGKAGLEAGSWRDPDTKIETFRAEIFGES